MVRFEMKYFDTYYFCSIIQYLMGEGSFEFAKTLSEYTDPLSLCEREDFPKEPYLMGFINYAVERILFEQNEYMARDIEEAIENDGYDAVFNLKHKVFYDVREEYRYTPFEKAIIHYFGVKERMLEWISSNIEREQYEYLEVASLYTEYLEETYYKVIEKISKEVFYILFQNRSFLLQYNKFISDVFEGESQRKYIPKWVKNAVTYRDSGRCVICGKNLTGLLETEEIREKQFDHIVPLEKGGLNDICNLQLMCQTCNEKKGTDAYTSDNYSFYYDNER